MSKFYGQVQVEGFAQTIASRRGSQFIKVSAQSWDGSVITRLHYDDNGKLMVDLQIGDGSSWWGKTVFYGTIEQLKAKLS